MLFYYQKSAKILIIGQLKSLLIPFISSSIIESILPIFWSIFCIFLLSFSIYISVEKNYQFFAFEDILRNGLEFEFNRYQPNNAEKFFINSSSFQDNFYQYFLLIISIILKQYKILRLFDKSCSRFIPHFKGNGCIILKSNINTPFYSHNFTCLSILDVIMYFLSNSTYFIYVIISLCNFHSFTQLKFTLSINIVLKLG